MKIIVRANCITGALSTGLEIIFPEVSVHAIHGAPNQTTKEKTELIISEASSNDYYLVTQWPQEFSDHIPTDKIIKVPNQTFVAFHPDLVYCQKRSNNQLTIPHYNSRIVLQAFCMGIPANDVSKFFNHDVFRELGYFGYWDDSVTNLKKRFLEADFSDEQFRKFFRRLARKGIFMHSINHPNIEFLIELVKLIALKINPEKNPDSCVFNIADGLMSYVSPVYPEIAFELGVKGSYTWSINRKNYNLDSFIRFSYENYKSQGFQPDDLMFNITDSQQKILRSVLQ